MASRVSWELSWPGSVYDFQNEVQMYNYIYIVTECDQNMAQEHALEWDSNTEPRFTGTKPGQADES